MQCPSLPGSVGVGRTVRSDAGRALSNWQQTSKDNCNGFRRAERGTQCTSLLSTRLRIRLNPGRVHLVEAEAIALGVASVTILDQLKAP
jgi:ferric-dicitrate binding protein FerR (iron transport regulator)